MEAVAKLKNCPIPPRKMRMVADLIRGERVEKALGILKFEPKVGSRYIEKLLISAISNWQNKHEDENVDGANLYVKTIFVDQGRTLKRLRPAPQGRAHRIRKRSNHVTLVLDSMNAIIEKADKEAEKKAEEVKSEAKAKASEEKSSEKKTESKAKAPAAKTEKAASAKVKTAKKAESKSAPKAKAEDSKEKNEKKK